MPSRTLYSEIMFEAKQHNPDLSPEQVADGIEILLGQKILPEVLRNLSLPAFPSWSAIAIAGSKARKRKTTRLRTTPNLEERRAVIQQIEKVRLQLGWDGSDSSASKQRFLDSTSITLPSQIDFRLKKEVPKPKPSLGKVTKTRTQETIDDSAETTWTQDEPSDPVALSEDLQRKIVTEPAVEKIFKEIETAIRELIESRSIPASLNVTFRSDAEISSWKKYVVTIDLPHTISFDEKMNIWTIFDLTIRKEIMTLSKDADDDTKKYLSKFNKSLFLHVNL